MDAQAAAGRIRSPITVISELHDETWGELHDWVGERRDSGLFVEPSRDVQAVFNRIADFVWANYPPEHAAHFLDGADPWLVAHAKAEGGLVVTHEIPKGLGALTPKIPNVCKEFGLDDPIGVYEMIRRLGFRGQ